MSDPVLERIIDRPHDATPQLTDYLIIANMEATPSGDEEKTLISDVVTSISLVREPVAATTGNIVKAGANNTIVDTGITSDSSQNVSNVNTLTLNVDPVSDQQAATKRYADTKLAKSANLSDVASAATSRTNLGLGTAATKAASDNAQSSVASISGATTTNHFAVFADGLGTLKDGGTGSQFLVAANNLSDIGSKATSFNNISPLSSKGDVLGYNGSSNVRVPPTVDGYVYTLDSTMATGTKWAPAGAVAGFADNTVFCSNFGISVPTTPGPLPAGVIASASIGSKWTLAGDNYGMRCGQTGGYLCTADIPLSATGLSGGRTYFYIAVNGTKVSKAFPMGNVGAISGNSIVLWAVVNGILSLATGDVVTIVGVTNSINPLITYFNSPDSDGLSISFRE